MKLSNKIIIISVVVCAFCIGAFASLFIKLSNNGIKPEYTKNNSNEDTVQTENNVSEPVKNKERGESYILKLEGSVISAYIELPDGSHTLWNSTVTPPTLSEKDKATLERGISTKSFEELCLYFESYSS